MMNRNRSRQSGLSILSGVIAAAMIGISLMPLSSALRSKISLTRATSQKIEADAMASELAELFRAHTETAFTNFLRDPSRSTYFYCAHINLSDRDHSKTLNPDTIADLPTPPAIPGANRYYQVNIVNIKTPLIPRTDICGQSFSATSPNADERYLVAVGVSWPDMTPNSNIINSVSLSTLIPDKQNHAL